MAGGERNLHPCRLSMFWTGHGAVESRDEGVLR
jgi:hypothetical protein